MKAKDLTQDQKLAVRCQTCGARPGERCELNIGGPRTEAHRARGSSAADAVMRQGGCFEKDRSVLAAMVGDMIAQTDLTFRDALFTSRLR